MRPLPKHGQPLLFLIAGALLASVAFARPDPLGQRQRPTLDKPAAAPPAAPARKPAGDEAGDARPEDEGRAHTATAQAARPDKEAARPPAAATGKEAGAAKDASGRRALGAEDGSYRLGPKDQIK